MGIAKKKYLEKIPKNIPGIFPVSGVAEQIGNRDHRQCLLCCQINCQW